MRTFVLAELSSAVGRAEGASKAELSKAASQLSADIGAFLKMQSSDNLMNLIGSWAAGYRLLEGR